MPRRRLSQEEKARGHRLATTLREARVVARKSREDVARQTDLSAETIRRIENRQVPNPGFFTVLAIAENLRIPFSKLRAARSSDAKR
jgi:transcriptional regulator with XRE-family HTH domain